MKNIQKIQRQSCQKARKSLTDKQQTNHYILATRRLLLSNLIKKSTHIAVFLPLNGELNTRVLINHLCQKQKKIYLPKLYNNKVMKFVKYKPSSLLKKNSFNILEPFKNEIICVQKLDLIIMPLACFDDKGERIGMGAGYYDRALQHKLLKPHSAPTLIGWAHQCQQINSIKPNNWDIKMDYLITEENLYRFKLPKRI
jgi:5-formyltetrahydrofolate cyclo-ligase